LVPNLRSNPVVRINTCWPVSRGELLDRALSRTIDLSKP
jgi:hypothetical protein